MALARLLGMRVEIFSLGFGPRIALRARAARRRKRKA